MGRSEILRKYRVPLSCTGYFGGLVSGGFRSALVNSVATSVGAMCKGYRPPRIPDISWVPMWHTRDVVEVSVDGGFNEHTIVLPGLPRSVCPIQPNKEEKASGQGWWAGL